ncbi:Methyltransferase small domain/Ribosomal protein L11 methyltransferase (PrmA)/Met-10+ like-protein/tRNA (Uracil-5-)-methyltransferase/Putative RNA methylase family UPF0020/Methyltransferase domain/RNA cap guanine-N2 methyltransferase, putative [Trypanosoma equiperdum]|uniref:Trimethylguanosine synthase n=1 Tax=Trypanosoma equiperdum TaxID=5694 RepID=A0A1G4IEM6_TRYEQ|nr:Methyltransferase small domain/Ribosomal protein L11 methyltransferase (PrmA)/Met-10+ like-protein/tRNA (Uracil-5-)-methyltransferase/Putative RNA methylase family UPF0020/Methyltransferase domain/RNA cap guanine-N2 methyltransferase, putative [Trypanosoma equiperdum]
MAKLGTLYSDDKSVEKYYGQRHRLWSRFDDGVWMTKKGWFEVTPEGIARSSASLHDVLKDKGCCLDLFCGCGGDTVQLAQVFEKVIAVDIDPDAIEAAKKNAEVYGVSTRVTFLCADYRTLKPENFSVNAVHCSPPWGGELYAGAPFFDLQNSLCASNGIKISDFYELLSKFSNNITMFLPRNTLLYSVVPPKFAGTFAVCRHYANEKCKGITILCGDLVASSQLKAPSAPVYSIRNKIPLCVEKRGRGSL